MIRRRVANIIKRFARHRDYMMQATEVFEAPGVEPVFPEKRQAIDYAETRVLPFR